MHDDVNLTPVTEIAGGGVDWRWCLGADAPIPMIDGHCNWCGRPADEHWPLLVNMVPLRIRP